LARPRPAVPARRLRADPALPLYAVGADGAHLPARALVLGIHPRRDLDARVLAGGLDGARPHLALPAGGHPWLRPGAGRPSRRCALVRPMALWTVEIARNRAKHPAVSDGDPPIPGEMKMVKVTFPDGAVREYD